MVKRPDQDESQACAFHKHIEHPVDAVVEIDIGRASPVSLNESSRAWPKGGMGRRVAFGIIGFRFDHRAGKCAPIELASDQVPCATDWIALKKRPLEHGA